jgi:hypothetical protein
VLLAVLRGTCGGKKVGLSEAKQNRELGRRESLFFFEIAQTQHRNVKNNRRESKKVVLAETDRVCRSQAQIRE